MRPTSYCLHDFLTHRTMTPIGHSTRIIYFSIILILASAVAALPLISIDIQTSAPALVRPAAEISVIRATVTGTIDSVLARENTTVRKGQLLYVIDHRSLDLSAASLGDRMSEVQSLIRDLQMAIRHASTPDLAVDFQTAACRQSFRSYAEAWHQATLQRNKSYTTFRRQRVLFESKVIAAQEFEHHEFEYHQAQQRVEELVQETRKLWEHELRNHEEQVRELEHQLTSLQWQKSQHYIHAPVAGTLQPYKAIYPGTLVAAQEELSLVSPDTALQILALLPVEDIARVEPGMRVTVQIDALHHHQWGLASGRVVSVAQESKQLQQAWIYEVRCSLDRHYLEHANGTKGHIRKGMTGIAHFQRGSRTLWELVFMKLDDLANPYADNSR